MGPREQGAGHVRGGWSEAGSQEGPGRRNGRGRNRNKAGQEWRPPRQEGQRLAKLRHHKWINRQVTEAANKGDLDTLLDTIHCHISQMNSINLVTALHRVTKLVSGGSATLSVAELLELPHFSQLWQKVASQIELHLTSPLEEDSSEPFEVQCMSIVCWSCATLRLYASNLLSIISDIAKPRLFELKPFELSNMVWAYAKLQLGKADFYDAVAERLLQRAHGEFTLQCLSMMAWSFASAKQRHILVFGSLAQEMTRNAWAVKPQEIANSLWAYAKINCADHALFFALADAACSSDLVWCFKPQELSNTVWAFATVSLHHPALFEKVAKAVVRKRHELLPQNTANILWAYAKLQSGRRSGVFRALLADSAHSLPSHKPQEISAIVWAAAREEYPLCKKLFDAVAENCVHRLGEFPPQALANMVKSFAVAGGPSHFIHAMTVESIGRLRSFDTLALLTIFRGEVLLYWRQLRQLRARGGTVVRDHSSDWITDALCAMAVHMAAQLQNLQESEVMNLGNSLRLLLANADKPLPEVAALKTAFSELLVQRESSWDRQPYELRDGRGFLLSAEDEDDLLGAEAGIMSEHNRDVTDRSIFHGSWHPDKGCVSQWLNSAGETPGRLEGGFDVAKILPQDLLTDQGPDTTHYPRQASYPRSEHDAPSWSVWNTPIDSAWLQDALGMERMERMEPVKVAPASA